jgi:hypothetical protein
MKRKSKFRINKFKFPHLKDSNLQTAREFRPWHGIDAEKSSASSGQKLRWEN